MVLTRKVYFLLWMTQWLCDAKQEKSSAKGKHPSCSRGSPHPSCPPHAAPKLREEELSNISAKLSRYIDSCIFSVGTCEHKGVSSTLSSAIKKGDLGKCAFVGLGDSLLREKRGNEIDGHDSVFRMGFEPLKKYEAFVGSKTNYVFCRPKATDECYRKPPRDIYGFPMLSRDVVLVVQPTAIKHPHPHVLYWAGDHLDELKKEISMIFNQVMITEKREMLSATAGFFMVLSLWASGFCKQLSLYGIGCDGKGKVFSKLKAPNGRMNRSMKQHVKLNHSPMVEAQVFTALDLCIFSICSNGIQINTNYAN